MSQLKGFIRIPVLYNREDVDFESMGIKTPADSLNVNYRHVNIDNIIEVGECIKFPEYSYVMCSYHVNETLDSYIVKLSEQELLDSINLILKSREDAK